MKEIKVVTQELIEWAVASLNEVVSTYSFPPEYKDKGLPDVACEITDVIVRRDTSGDSFKFEQVEQRRVRVYQIDLIFMTDPEPPDVATNFLSDCIDQLTAAMELGTLKQNYGYIGTQYSASLRPPFIEFDDGTRGRQATFSLEVGERI